MRYENVCTACSEARCSRVRYLGRGNVERSVPTGGRRTWHAFGQPSNVDFLDGVACAPPVELESHAVVPVTHTRSGYAIGLWLYYARGCSDLGWDLGRTAVATNRVDLALKLIDRVRVRGVERSAGGQGSPSVSEDQGRDAHALAVDLALQLHRKHRRWASLVVHRAMSSRHLAVSRYFNKSLRAMFNQSLRAMVANRSAEARSTGREDSVGRDDAAALALLLRDAARGLVGGTARSIDGACHAHGDVDSNVSHRRCVGACSRRAAALAHVFAGDGSAMDVLNARLLRQLCGRRNQLDTAVLLRQPQGMGSVRWATEIWDVRSLCERKGALAAEPFYRWLNGSRCDPAPMHQWRVCMACNGSQLQRFGCGPRANQ